MTSRRAAVLSLCVVTVGAVLMALQWFRPSAADGPDDTVAAQAAADMREAARQRLFMKIPGAKVDLDATTGAPKFVYAQAGFLTEPSPGRSANAVVKAFINENRDLYGFDASVLERAEMKRDSASATGAMQNMVWAQELDGIPVYGAQILANVTKNAQLVNIGSTFVPSIEKAADRAQLASASPAQVALSQALSAVTGKDVQAAAEVLDAPAGAPKKQRLQSAQTTGDVHAQLTWMPTGPSKVALAWDVVLTEKSSSEMWRVVVDANTGAALRKTCLTSYFISKEQSAALTRTSKADPKLPNATTAPAVASRFIPPVPPTSSVGSEPASYRVFTADSPTPMLPGFSTSNTGQPPEVSRTLQTLISMNTTASPNGWIDDGVNETRGNNVDAHTDLDANDSPDLPRPQGSPARVFDFALDLTQAPSAYRSAAITQLFYWCNFTHDKMYELGFNEASGNFQNSNFSRGGNGNDAVQADAQDGSGVNNANFGTPPDGQAPRMQMYTWTPPTPDRDGDFDATVVIHEYTHGLSGRLVGGGTGISQLQTGGMGEGWSDFYALSLLSNASMDPTAAYPLGAYVVKGLVADNYYRGIRRYPYTPDMSKNPLTFGDIIVNNEVHKQGEVWCMALWEARANLIAKYGFAGNQLMMQLVTDGMKLSPQDPNFLQARDAILAADLANNGGANLKALWTAFAKRGMGVSATSPDSSTTAGVVEAFDMPGDLFVTDNLAFNSGGAPVGPFSPASKTYTLRNISSLPINWTAAKTQSWVTVSPTSGTLAADAVVTLTVSINSAANALNENSYTDTVTLTNTSTGSGNTTRKVNLAVARNYTSSSTTFSWIDPSSHTALSLPDDGFSGAQTIPFAFKFYNLSQTQLYVGSNGLLGFASAGMNAWENTDLPRDAAPNGIIAPYWDDLYPPQAGASVRIGTVGASPNRKLVVTWSAVPMISAGAIKETVTFQAILNETTNDIVFQYLEVRPGIGGYGGGRSATVGVEHPVGSLAKKYSFNGSTVLANNSAILFTRNAPLPAVSIGSAAYSVNETTANASIVVNLSAASANSVAVNYATANGSAVAPGDYTSKSGTLTFAPGSTTQTISVPIINDTAIESNEAFTLSISSPLNADLGATTSTTVTIISDDVPGTFSVNGRITEGANGLAGVSVSDGTRTATTDASGNYSLQNVPNGSYTITPTLAGYTFTPATRSATVNNAALNSQDFSGTRTPTPPDITSGPTATPNPSTVNQSVSFGCAGTDAQAITWSWDFGDGSAVAAGDSVNHVFTAAGVYTVTVTATDSFGASTTRTLTMTVNAGGAGGGGGGGEEGGGGGLPPGGGGSGGGASSGDDDGDGIPNGIDPDNDNDGFTNDEEAAAGTNPFDANSHAPGTGSGGPPGSFNVAKFQAKLDAGKPGKDGLTLSGGIELPAGFSTAGVTLIVDVGGVQKSFTLDAKGRAKSGSDSAGIKLKLVKKVFKGGVVPLQIKLANGSWAAFWNDEGINTPGTQSATMKAAIVLGKRAYVGSFNVTLSNKNGSVKAKKP